MTREKRRATVVKSEKEREESGGDGREASERKCKKDEKKVS